MIPERNGVVLRFPNYGSRYARADVYRLQGYGYVFVANVFYSTDNIDIHADVDTTLDSEVLEKTLANQHLIIIVPDSCVRVYNPWHDQGLEL